ncbi:hypothetical protein ABB37_03478 [Leptomonas pyrrhocoris]|uniref:Ubiquitin-like domain-containing protein n=1 Tax=Leptomonas pyrrhocoris TaxID=157538 RepID=A0A0N0DX52_LEPPY|nr:hypothetical protein ABB37_03478 [Leptomonas pyrrhocoris]KPA82402.1 hypothetical protein ABB37_03478 [Leptomonas pyrrhocoris]|eukprot:XP_015660841.1 hypothetical protein ABB37_03478 [Leptomonas pyrrhocoris]
MTSIHDGGGAGPTRCIYVLSDVDGYRYKLVVQGEVLTLTAKRIKRYLQKATGIPPQQQLLSFNGAALRDDVSGEDAGLFDGAILRLQQVASDSHRLHNGSGGAQVYEDSPNSDNAPADGSRQTPTRRADHHADEPTWRPTSPLRRDSLLLGTVRQSGAPVATTAAASSAALTATHSPPIQPRCAENARDGTAQFRARSFTQQSSFPASSPQLASAVLPTGYANNVHPCVEHRHQHRLHHDPWTPTEDLETEKDMGPTAYGGAQAYCHNMEAKVAALSIENVRLREQLQLVARQAADAHADWKQEEEVARLKTALTASKRGIVEAEQAAAQRWRVKEEELVRELDLLRGERRQLQEDSSGQEAKLQELLHSMEGEIRSLKYELHEKDEALLSTRLALADLQGQLSQRKREVLPENGRLLHNQQEEESGLPSHTTLCPLLDSIDVLTEEALSHLSYFLSTPAPLQLDPANDTCTLPVSDTLNMLVTLDREAEHLYLYVALLNGLPTSPVQRMRVYEMLLQGALLGKDMAGGGVGLSMESNLVLMSTSADLRHNGALALAAAAPSFVESAKVWAERLDAFFA